MNYIRQLLQRVWPPGKILFTLSSAGLLLLAAILTGSWARSLTPVWQDILGFAPRDLLYLDLARIFTSALVTSGGLGFWLPLGALTGLAFIAEALANTKRAAAAFWLSHLGSTIVGSLFIWLTMQISQSQLIRDIYTGRDVGPSAGYFGCMGLIVYHFPSPWNYFIGFAILAALSGGLVYSAQHGAFIDVSAGLSHLVAFPLGWLTEVFLSSKSHAHNPG